MYQLWGHERQVNQKNDMGKKKDIDQCMWDDIKDVKLLDFKKDRNPVTVCLFEIKLTKCDVLTISDYKM